MADSGSAGTATGGAASGGGGGDIKARLSRAIQNLNVAISAGAAPAQRGALIQVWMPQAVSDGSTVLSAQGLPFAVAGVGDLLALFRCVSCRYRFSTDASKPALMGAIGRVYASCEPEMCNDVQQYDRQVYLRVTEAQRCRVHSTLVMPVFDPSAPAAAGPLQPVAVFEVVQSGRGALFPEVLQWLAACLQEVDLATSDLESLQLAWGMQAGGDCAPPPVGSPEGVQRLTLGAGATAALAGAGAAAAAVAVPRLRGASSSGAGAGGAGGACCVHEPAGSEGGAAPGGGGAGGPVRRGGGGAAGSPGGRGSGGGGLTRQGSSAAPAPAAQTQPQTAAPLQLSPERLAGMSADEMLALIPDSPSAGGDGARQAALSAIAAAAVSNPSALEALQRWHALQRSAGGGSNGGSSGANNGGANNAGSKQQAAGAEEEEGEGEEIGGDEDLGDGDADADGSGSGSGDDGVHRGAGGAGRAPGASAAAGRTPLGAGRRLTFEELQSQFGLGLKEAAANLGICATTLKRACRRHGVTRWPRRQIAKLSRALQANQPPPPGLVEKAVHSTGLSQQQMATSLAVSGAAAVASCARPAGGGGGGGSGSAPIPIAGAGAGGAGGHAVFIGPGGVPMVFAAAAPGGAGAPFCGGGSYPPQHAQHALTALPDGSGGYVLATAPAGGGQLLYSSAGSYGSLSAVASAPEGLLVAAGGAPHYVMHAPGAQGGAPVMVLGPAPAMAPAFGGVAQQLQLQQQHQHHHHQQQHMYAQHAANAGPAGGGGAAGAGDSAMESAGFLDLIEGDDDLMIPSGGLDALISEIAAGAGAAAPGAAPAGCAAAAAGGAGAGGAGAQQMKVDGSLATVWD